MKVTTEGLRRIIREAVRAKLRQLDEASAPDHTSTKDAGDDHHE